MCSDRFNRGRPFACGEVLSTIILLHESLSLTKHSIPLIVIRHFWLIMILVVLWVHVSTCKLLLKKSLYLIYPKILQVISNTTNYKPLPWKRLKSMDKEIESEDISIILSCINLICGGYKRTNMICLRVCNLYVCGVGFSFFCFSPSIFFGGGVIMRKTLRNIGGMTPYAWSDYRRVL